MEIYRKVYIKSEADLPKEDGWYFVHWKIFDDRTHTQMAVQYYDESIKGLWFGKNWFDWYLQPMTGQEPKEQFDPNDINIKPVANKSFHIKGKVQEQAESYATNDNPFGAVKEQESNLREELIKGNDIDLLLKRCKQLKQSDGEGWAIGNFVEKILNSEL